MRRGIVVLIFLDAILYCEIMRYYEYFAAQLKAAVDESRWLD
jgi:hypothetical protein